MKRLIEILIAIYVIVIATNFISVNGTESVTLEPSEALLTTITSKDNKLETVNDQKDEMTTEQRSIDFHGNLDASAANEDRHAAFRKRAKPLKSIFLGLYKNYKSTYLGNKTSIEYRNAMRTRKLASEEMKEKQQQDIQPTEAYSAVVVDQKESEALTEKEFIPKEYHENDAHLKISPTLNVEESKRQLNHNDSNKKQRSSKKKRKKQRLRKRNHRRNKHGPAVAMRKVDENKNETIKTTNLNNVYRYDFGHGYNMSLDLNNDIVNLHLDGESLNDLMQGRIFKDASEGRGKKYEMITRVLPLFIIPFLIQSAVVPFIVTKLKLLLMKSILVGKLAIFLLVISAIRNSNKAMQTYEVAPSYWAGEPSRRSELAAAASSAAYNGYRVEGKPAAWIN